ncbi:MAG: sporulation integral membrane protein YtvI [Firmicutes bacterium HGW-Firmicutes-10]|nr:MAG: sporulation integral membrane protein YtvI [Firmicutes bacterium HGW-Firmicutes-10]
MDIKRKQKFLVEAAYLAVILGLVYVTFKYFIPLIFPFVLGFIIAFAFKPLIRSLTNKLKLPNKVAALIVIGVFYLLLLALTIFLGIEVFLYLKDFFQEIPQLYNNVLVPWLSNALNNLEELASQIDPMLVEQVRIYSQQILESLGNLITSISVGSVSYITNIASKVPLFLVGFLLTVISSFFIAMDYQLIVNFLLDQISPSKRSLLIEAQLFLVSTLHKYAKSYLMIMSITFVELTIGFSILGIESAIVVAFLIAIFDILPVAGTGGVMIPWMIFTFLEGDSRLGFGLLIIYLIVTVIRNIIEPKIIGDQVGLHPLLTLFAMYIGLQLFGVAGLFGFPITLAILNGLHRNKKIILYKQHKETEVVQSEVKTD